MAIGGGLAIDRPVEAEMGADALGRQADELRDQLFERRLGHALGRGAVQVDIDRQRLGDADRVAELDRAAARQPRGDDILSSEERRAGDECVRTYRSRWSTSPYKKIKIKSKNN